MKDSYLLHIFNPIKNVSPFDVNMAYEAEFDGVIPYSEVTLEDVYSLTQDTIFSRGTKGIKRTGIFIGGRDFGLAIDMLNRAKSAMMPPFEVSVFADPSGAITTAAALIANIQFLIKQKYGTSLEGRRIDIIGGTGPVGTCASVIAANCGAKVHIVSHRGTKVAERYATEYGHRFEVELYGEDGSTKDKITNILRHSEIIISTVRAGIRVLSKDQLSSAENLLLLADINAVPPTGIEGIAREDNGKVLDFTPQKAVGVGALAIGDLKYKVHFHMFEMMRNTQQPIYLDHESAFQVAQDFAEKLYG